MSRRLAVAVRYGRNRQTRRLLFADCRKEDKTRPGCGRKSFHNDDSRRALFNRLLQRGNRPFNLIRAVIRHLFQTITEYYIFNQVRLLPSDFFYLIRLINISKSAKLYLPNKLNM